MSEPVAVSTFGRLARVCVNLEGCFPYQAGRPAFERGEGAYLFTDRGERAIDLVNAFGSVTLGHAHPEVVSAVCATVSAGVPASGHHLAAAVAERIAADTAPDAAVAFFKTGTEAVRSAAVAVRAVRQRPLLVSAGFHGWDDLWAAPTEPFTVTPAGVFDCFYVADALQRFLADRAHEVAAAVISPDYLHIATPRLRRLFEICREYGIPTIADDVKYGYRFGAGSSLQQIGANADVYVYAKGLANGWPLAAVVGPLEFLAPMPRWCSTLTYEAPSLAAAHATLDQLARLDAQRRIGLEGARFIAGARDVLSAARLPIELAGVGHAFQFVFGDAMLAETFHEWALREGLLLSPGDNQLPSLAFAGDVVDESVEALRRLAARLADRFPHLDGAPLSDEARWQAAWSQMDGFPDDGAIDERTYRTFLTERLAANAINGAPPQARGAALSSSS